jgi:negative regulator of sigma E activity
MPTDSTPAAESASPSPPVHEQLSRLLDADLPAAELPAVLRDLRESADARDALTALQLVRDAVAGVRALDDGYTQRILARVARGDQPRWA